jgi:cell division protein FtsQ
MLKQGKVISGQSFLKQRPRQKKRVVTRTHFFWLYKRWFFKFSLTLLIGLSGILLWQKVGDPHLFPVKHVKIVGDLAYLQSVKLRKIILPFLDKGFIRLDSLKLKEQLLQTEPWLQAVRVQRFWPATLVVYFSVKKPIAWMGRNNLLDSEGNVFRVEKLGTLPSTLPRFISPLGQQKYLLDAYQQWVPVLAPRALTIKTLQWNPQQFWSLRLNNGLQLYLGNNKPAEQLARFVKVYPDVLASKVTMIEYIDLRYPQGMAVKFRH